MGWNDRRIQKYYEERNQQNSSQLGGLKKTNWWKNEQKRWENQRK